MLAHSKSPKLFKRKERKEIRDLLKPIHPYSSFSSIQNRSDKIMNLNLSGITSKASLSYFKTNNLVTPNTNLETHKSLFSESGKIILQYEIIL